MKNDDIMKFAGAWKNISKKEIEDMKKMIEKLDMEETKRLLLKFKKVKS